MGPTKSRYSSNALVRGLEILKMFNSNETTLSLQEIANKLGVNRTVPFRLLKTLESFGYIYQNEETKKYQLAPKVLELGFSYLSSIQLPEIVQPYLDQLRDELGVSIYLSLLDDFDVVYIGQARVKEYQGIFINTGIRLPAHATAPGKVLLAFKTPEELEKLIHTYNLKPFTNKTIINPSELKENLHLIKKQGFSFSNNEFQENISSVAVPLFNQKGEIVAAINVVATDSFFNRDMLYNAIVTPLLEKSKEISFIIK